jgi:thymidylate synthase (FAD)
MQAIKAYTQIFKDFEGQKVLQKLELVGRTCYKSEDKITEDSAAKFVAGLIKRGHEAMLEHVSITVKFVTDRGISHEIVRHRLASYAQESTRYCNYSQDKFGHELTFIIPDFLEYGSEGFKLWKDEMKQVEKTYFAMLEAGHTPQEARSVLPNSLKTELVMTANLREWRAFFKLRAANSTGAAHPQMLEITRPLLDDLKAMIPVVFDDITYEEKVVKEDGKE